MSSESKQRGAFLPKFLGGVVVLFIAILATIWYIAEKTDPVILDEHGNYRTGGNGQAY